MNEFLVLFREPDGRKDDHTKEELDQHRSDWKTWMDRMIEDGRLAGGNSLTLEGRIISAERQISEGIHTIGTEIVGGYLLINADNLNEAAIIMQNCPVFDFGAYTEIRSIKK